ncbi:MAG: TolC family protein [Elusimicrobia bacterium]|nr:TolC family protein [Elusimicrobiota bacterium]
MRRFASLLALSLLSSAGAAARDAASPPQSLTLRQAFQKALAASERIAASEQAVRQAEALYRETLGSSLPALSYKYNTLWQDQSGLDTSGGLGTFTRSPQSEGAFQLRKTGLTGYRELAAIRAGKSFVDQRRHEKQRVEQLLLSDVAGAYYGVLEAEDNLATTRRLIQLAQERLNELNERARVGRSRSTDPLGARFQLTLLGAQEQEASRLAGARRDLLGFLMAERTDYTLAASTDPVSGVPTLEYYMEQAQSRPDIRALSEAVETAQGALTVARSHYFPGLDLGANYYTERVGFRDPIDWDASLTVQFPIFSWGATRHAVAAATASLRRRDEELKAARREAELEVRNAYRDLLTARKKLSLAQEGVSVARKDYEFQFRDEKKGLVTSLEVLEALNRLNQAELTWTNIRLQARLAELNLELAAGASTGEALK